MGKNMVDTVNNSYIDPKIIKSFTGYIESSEEIYCTIKSGFFAILISHILFFLFVIFWLLIFCPIFISNALQVNSIPGYFFLILETTPVWALMIYVMRMLSAKYMLTDKKLIIKKGILRVKYKSYPYNKIKDIEATKKLTGLFFNSGSISFYIPKGQFGRFGLYVSIYAIKNPKKYCDILKSIKKEEMI